MYTRSAASGRKMICFARDGMPNNSISPCAERLEYLSHRGTVAYTGKIDFALVT